MPFTIPNAVDAGVSSQAEPDSRDFDMLALAMRGYGVTAGFAVTAQGSPNMSVAVGIGTGMYATQYFSNGGVTVTITTADSSNPRFDLIVIDNAGNATATAGTPAAAPVFPAPPASSIVLAVVYVATNTTTITTANITDKRILIPVYRLPGTPSVLAPDGTVPTFRGGAPLLTYPETVGATTLIGQVLPVIGGTTALVTGLPAPTLTATASNADDSEASWINHATSTVQFNPSGLVSAAFTVTRSGRLPEFFAYIKTDPSVITSVAYAIGLSSASLDVASAIAPAAAVVGAYFLYNTTAHGTAFWRTVTSDGSTRNTVTTTSSIAANTTYRMRIAISGVRGSSVSQVDFYINDVNVASHVANLPTFSTPLGYGVRVEALAGSAARNVKWARVALSGP